LQAFSSFSGVYDAVPACRPDSGEATVTVRSRTRQVQVPGVVLPAPTPPANMPLIGAALIFGGYVLVRAWRGRRSRQTTPAGATDDGRGCSEAKPADTDTLSS
jgi:hypothetical protein